MHQFKSIEMRCLMRGQRVNSSNILVRESITEALFILMKKQEFSKIKISELVEKAGVSRVSFYRNYNSKEEIIEDHLIDYCQDYWHRHFSRTDEFGLLLLGFQTLMSIGERLVLIEKAGLTGLLHQTILTIIRQDTPNAVTNNNFSRYCTVVYAGIISSVISEWVKNGCQETPENLAKMIFKLNLDETLNKKMEE